MDFTKADFRNTHSKYGYNSKEMLMMVVITGISNFIVIPAIIAIKKQHMTFQFNISMFTLLCSVMYHTLESIDCDFFFISEGQWHRLDNIGSIVCFQMLFTLLTDIRNLYYENLLNYYGLLITMLAQIKHPWDLNMTLIPIFLQIAICLAIVIIRKRLPILNYRQLSKGLLILCCAVVFFVKSQDEHQDYLRIYHGLWHCTVGIFSFYIWQCKLEEPYTWSDVWTKEPQSDFTYYKEK